MTSLSALIVALGLLINNTTAVIGGMLLAPIFWHTLGISLSIAEGKISQFKYHLWSIFKAIILAVFLTMILFWILPYHQDPGTEIISRSNPNIIHLLIAIFSGFAGAIAMAWPKISTSIIGVLIAAALIPPLGTISYGLIVFDLNLAGGATLLFITNLIAIIFSATIAFFMFGFRPISSEKAQNFMLNDIIWSIILIIIITIPLTWSLYKANIESSNEKIVKQIIIDQVKNITEKSIENIKIESHKDTVKINATIFTSDIIYPSKKQIIQEKIKNTINKEVQLNLSIVSTTQI